MAVEEAAQLWRGALLPRTSPGTKVQGPFVLAGTDLELDSASVSSEWTSESEQGDGEGERRRRKIRTWRVRHRLESDSESDSSSSSGRSSSSSSTSTGSSSSEGEVTKFKKQRLQMLKDWEAQKAKALGPNNGNAAAAPAVAGGAEKDRQTEPFVEVPLPLRPPLPATPSPAAPPPPVEAPRALEATVPLEWFNSGKRYRSFALAPAFLAQEDMDALHTAAHHSSVQEINDRKGYLAFKHRVWRFEAQLRILHPGLYCRLLDLMHRADEAKWRRLRRNSKKRKVYPEIEYISYDVAEMGEPCFIEPHVDNKSAVTMVAMLSCPGAYSGGRSCFRRAQGKEGHRELELQQGDVVLFRGEKLTHWITPVTAGRRVILQIELSRV